MNTHKELIEENLDSFKESWGGHFDDYICCHGHECNCGGLMADVEVRKHLKKLFQDTIDTVLKEERKRVNNNIELLACKVDERRMGAHGREIIKLKTLDKTPPKVNIELLASTQE